MLNNFYELPPFEQYFLAGMSVCLFLAIAALFLNVVWWKQYQANHDTQRYLRKIAIMFLFIAAVMIVTICTAAYMENHNWKLVLLIVAFFISYFFIRLVQYRNRKKTLDLLPAICRAFFKKKEPRLRRVP